MTPQKNEKTEDPSCQEVSAYTRNIKLTSIVCACPECHFCQNKPIGDVHYNKKYCCEDARVEHRRLKRAEQAKAEGREPGRRGRPPKGKESNS